MQWFDVYEYTGHTKQKSTFPFFGVKMFWPKYLQLGEANNSRKHVSVSNYCDKWIKAPLAMDEYM